MIKTLAVSITRAAGAANAQRVLATLHWAFTRAPLRQRQVTAAMLRAEPDAPTTLEAVREYARRATDREDFEGSYVTRQYLAARVEATAGDRLAVARACLETLSPTCVAVAGIEATAAQAAIVQRLRGTSKPEESSRSRLRSSSSAT